MTHCLICLSPILSAPKHQDYHDKCVTDAFGSINIVPNLKGTIDNFYVEAKKNLTGFCIAGVQAKLGLATRIQEERGLILSNQNSKYIIKPCPSRYKNLDINEHISQEIMRTLGFDVPICGILKFEDGTSAYFIKRYDRTKNGNKIHQEDMLAVFNRPNVNENIKYQGSYEEVAHTLKKIGGAQLAEEFIKRVISAYLIGNGDYHLKNISIIYAQDGIELSPVYDAVNTHVYGDTDHLCLDLFLNEPDIETFDDHFCLKKKDFVALANQVEVPPKIIIEFIEIDIVNNLDKIFALIQNSMLDDSQKENYKALIEERIRYLTL
ncbi:MAG: type II toxin-antitoxin system HipA family toxin [Gammaproteobacteria bacterium]|nr:MAG: type II toxin-antitoxin system HipA family toxin [Gammaproteobacteria bacterium]